MNYTAAHLLGNLILFNVAKAFGLAITAVVLASNLSAATISVSASAPTPDADDISNFVSVPNSFTGSNYEEVYMFSDRPAQGQSFTTGNNAGGYLLTAFTFQQGADGGNYHPANQLFNLRVVQPSGGSLTVLSSESANLGTTIADLDYVTFTLATPWLLSPNTVYGFDGATPGPPPATGFLVNGASTAFPNPDIYGGGSGYSSGGGGAGDTVFTARTNERVFLASLIAVPEPSSFALLALGSLLMLRRRIKH